MRRTLLVTSCSLLSVSLWLLLLPAGCAFMPGGPGAPFLSSPTGDFGATQGGVQDMGLARELIASGRVPPAEAFVVEGMFSEHDLGLTGEACARTLCLRGAACRGRRTP